MMFAVILGLCLVTAALTGSASAADAILIDFSSPTCPPCQAMKPTLEQLKQAGVPVRHVNVAAEPDLATRFGVRKTPTYIVMSAGKEVTRLVGPQSLEQLRAAVASDAAGPLIPTRAIRNAPDSIPAPQTRLAPINRLQDPSAPSFVSTKTPPGAVPAGSLEPMPSVSLADAVERAHAATVRLRVYDGHGFGAGTGTIIDTHGEEALVLTCGHLFRETKGEGKIEVDLFVGGQVRTVAATVVDYDADTRDIALVAIRPGFQVQPVQVLSSTERVTNGQSAFSFGCDRGDDPSRRDTRITGINKYNQHLGVSNLEIAGAPIDGRSGGGLFDAQGRLIGVCNAADYKGDVGIYAGPGNVQWQLDRVGMAKLYQPTQNGLAPAPPADRIASLPGANIPMSDPVVQPAALNAAPTAAPAMPMTLTDNEEVIVIVRSRNDPQSSRVMTLDRPSPELMQMIQSQGR